MRLSTIVGDYSQAGGIVDRQQVVATGGETTFNLTFVDGAEEVYKNGARLFKGSAKEYTTGIEQIILNEALEAGDEVILIGRASVNEIPFTKAVSETVVLEDGQLEVIFSSIETDGIEVYASGVLVDRGRLVSPTDFELTANSTTSITLKHSFPAGTIIEGVQAGRLTVVDADNLVVNDGEASKSLAARFAATQESVSYFRETTGMQLQDLAVGLVLQKWAIDRDTGIPMLDTSGKYPVLKIGKSYWNPQITGSSVDYQVISWDITGDYAVITAVETTSGLTFSLNYARRTSYGDIEGQEVDYGLITEAVYDQFDDGGL